MPHVDGQRDSTRPRVAATVAALNENKNAGGRANIKQWWSPNSAWYVRANSTGTTISRFIGFSSQSCQAISTAMYRKKALYGGCVLCTRLGHDVNVSPPPLPPNTKISLGQEQGLPACSADKCQPTIPAVLQTPALFDIVIVPILVLYCGNIAGASRVKQFNRGSTSALGTNTYSSCTTGRQAPNECIV